MKRRKYGYSKIVPPDYPTFRNAARNVAASDPSTWSFNIQNGRLTSNSIKKENEPINVLNDQADNKIDRF